LLVFNPRLYVAFCLTKRGGELLKRSAFCLTKGVGSIGNIGDRGDLELDTGDIGDRDARLDLLRDLDLFGDMDLIVVPPFLLRVFFFL
jgi:hypothetical protein